MTSAEAAEALEYRQMMWPNVTLAVDPAAEVRLWAKLLERYSQAQVIAAMDSFTGEWPPKLPEIRNALDPTPSYATALAEFRRMHALGYSSHRWSVVPWSHPLIAAFAEAHFAEWGQSPDGTSDPALVQSEAAFRAHMRESFSAVQRRYVAGELGSGTRHAVAEGRQIEGRTDGDRHMQVVRGAGEVGREREDG